MCPQTTAAGTLAARMPRCDAQAAATACGLTKAPLTGGFFFSERRSLLKGREEDNADDATTCHAGAFFGESVEVLRGSTSASFTQSTCVSQ
jgi:hypothetical protein